MAGRTGSEKLRIPRGIIMGYTERIVPMLQERGFERVSGYPPPWDAIWLTPDSPVGVVCGFGFGAPVAAIVLEELATLGSSHFVSLGIAGALSNDVGFGDAVLCTAAIRDEGVSHHYVSHERFSYPSSELTTKLAEVLRRRGTTFFEGPSWTTDAVYRETVEEASDYRDEGVLTVEMEAAALFTVASVRHVQLASVFAISDHLLASPQWQPSPDRSVVTQGLKNILDASIELLNLL